MPSSAKPLHADELSAFHAVRNDLYQASFELLRMPPRESSLRAVHKSLGLQAGAPQACQAVRDLEAGLASSDVAQASAAYARLFGGEAPKAAMRCTNPGCRHRTEAFAAVEILRGEDRGSELRVLSLLAGKTIDAFRSGSMPEASILTDVQARFLSHHAVGCLGQLAAGLRDGGDSLYSRVGVALGWLLEEDLRLLGSRPRAR